MSKLCACRGPPGREARVVRQERECLMPMIRVPSALRALTGGMSDVVVTAGTVRAALAELDRTHPGIAAKLLDAGGMVKPFIRIFVGADDIGSLKGLDTAVESRDEITIIP